MTFIAFHFFNTKIKEKNIRKKIQKDTFWLGQNIQINTYFRSNGQVD